MDKPSYVYMLASAPYGTLYIGSTTDLIKRVWQHREEVVAGFTKTYGVHMLVWFEIHNELISAAAREKNMKKWKRAWKVDFISTHNPQWRDLYEEIIA
ncbi:MAG: GIY-YIG nuclease family protein [Pseudomonadota bacterium]